MSTTLKEWLVKTIMELEEERDAMPGAVNEDAAMALAAMKLALASLEAEAVAFRSKLKPPAAIGSERWDYTDHRQPDGFELENCVIERLFTAPPAPVVVPDDVSGPLAHAYKELTPTFMRNHIDVFERYGIYPDGSAGIQAMRIALDGMNRRAAMLQGADGNYPAHSGCRPAQNCISPAQDGESPVIPDGWVLVPEEPTHEMLEAGDEQFGTYDVYRRMIAASPQQEVK